MLFTGRCDNIFRTFLKGLIIEFPIFRDHGKYSLCGHVYFLSNEKKFNILLVVQWTMTRKYQIISGKNLSMFRRIVEIYREKSLKVPSR